MARNVFQDPLGRVADYAWTLNHETEQKVGRGRDVQQSMNVAGTMLITEQGDIEPFQLQLSGAILERPQLVAMYAWQALCDTQTIFFTDFSGDSYEVVITDFAPVKIAGRNRRGAPYGNDLWYWTYTITMDVIAVRGGTLYDAGARS